MTTSKDQKLASAVRMDMEYQRLLAQCGAMEAEYERILASLPAQDQALLEQYISLGEELEHRRTCLALELREG